MASALSNGTSATSGSENNSPTITMHSSAKQSAKSAATPIKMADSSRKQGSNANDPTPRRAAPQKAWTSGMNPITQRSSTPAQQNGTGNTGKASQKHTNHEAIGQEKFGHDRLIYLMGQFMGKDANITVKSGDTFAGIFFGATMESHELVYALKMVQKLKMGELHGVKASEEQYVGMGEDHSMSFELKDVVDLAVEGVKLLPQDKRQNGSANGFRTDTDISGNMARSGRDLQRWTSPTDADVSLSLDDPRAAGAWDQFQANEKLFGLKSDYDENIYTTRIDRSNPQYKQREAEAHRIAREIEGSSTTNAHQREERGIIDEDGEQDEEAKYSGVYRQRAEYPPLQSSNPNRYIPPAHRPPSGKPTVQGAPVDPAIISSQMARPEASPQRVKESTSKERDSLMSLSASGETSSLNEAKEPVQEVLQKEANVSINARPAEVVKLAVPNATANVEVEVLDSFKQFAEKQKMQVADHKRQRVSHDKAIKLNDLKGFSKNFKLNTPVPKDLVPILAKDKKKQDEIVEKAQRNTESQVTSPSKSLARSGDQAVHPKSIAESKRDPPRAPLSTFDRQDLHRQAQPPRGPQASMPSRERIGFAHSNSPQVDQGLMSHRLANNQRERQAGRSVAVPSPIPVHNIQKASARPSASGPQVPSSQASSTVRTPTSTTSAKFNVKAHEFKPNPAANTFKPTAPSVASSPRSNGNVRPPSRVPSPSDFFGDKKPLPFEERPSILENFNPLKYLKEKAVKEGKTKDLASNGGMAYAHATPVRWSDVVDGDEKSYKDLFEDVPAATSGVSPQPSATSPANPNLAHLHQLPPHLQQGPQGMPSLPTPQPAPYQGPHQQQHLYPGVPHQFDEHRMHVSPSATTNYSTPRMQNNFVAHSPAVPPMAPYHYGQPSAYMMGPGGPQPPNFRQYPAGPPFMPSPGPGMSAPMMVHQSSQGGYPAPQGIPVPQMPLYAAGPGPYNAPSQPPSGYPSPGRGGAPMMMHSGSYQGQTPQMHQQQFGQPYYAQQPPPHLTQMRGYPSPQPHYSQSPQPQYHYPPQPSRMPSHGYGHHPQGPPQALPGQQNPPPVVPIEGGEAMK